MISRTQEGNVSLVLIEDTTDLASDTLPRTDANARNYRCHMEQVRKDARWVGGSMATITDILANGWPDGVARVEELAEELKAEMPAPKTFKRKQKWSDDGDESSWEREQAGHDEIWRTSRRQQQRGPATVELLVPWGANAHASAESLQWNGVVLCVLADLLESAGYRVGATLVATTAIGGYTTHVSQIVVKRPDMPLNMSSLVPVVAHPGVFRWHGINLISLCPDNVGMGHGSMTSMSQLPKSLSLFHNTSIILSDVTYREAAVQEIRRILALLND
jgi:hypothetical protein